MRVECLRTYVHNTSHLQSMRTNLAYYDRIDGNTLCYDVWGFRLLNIGIGHFGCGMECILPPVLPENATIIDHMRIRLCKKYRLFR